MLGSPLVGRPRWPKLKPLSGAKNKETLPQGSDAEKLLPVAARFQAGSEIFLCDR